MARDYQVISTDDHIIEPPGLFDGRLPAAYADRTPQLVEDDEGAAWRYDGKTVRMSGLSTAAGQKVEEFSPKGKTYEAMRPGCYDPRERLRDMDQDGVDAQVCLATLPGIAGATFIEIADKPYAAALLRAYNDWLVEEWCAPDPDRLLGAAVLPLWDPEATAAEVRRAREIGLKAVSLPSHPHTIEGVAAYPDPSWEPVWNALEETGLPAEVHIVSGKADTTILTGGGGSPAQSFVCLAPSSNMQTLANFLFSGILVNHPGLKIVSSESGIGWAPYFIERADYSHRKHRFWTGSKIDIMPSELFARSIFVNFISDRAGIELRHMIGVDNIMLGTDYPHTDTSWPETQRIIKEQMGDIPEEDRRKICALNAVRVFGLDHSGA